MERVFRVNKRVCQSLKLSLIWILVIHAQSVAAEQEGLPVYNHSDKAPEYFQVPGQERAMRMLNQLLFQHKVLLESGSTSWGLWLPCSTLWPNDQFSPALCKELSADTGMPHADVRGAKYVSAEGMASATRAWLLNREFYSDGYVSTHQHRGLAHPGGWPFPVYGQTGGQGWIFSATGMPYVQGLPVVESMAGWTLQNMELASELEERGFVFELGPHAVLELPRVDVKGIATPFFRMDWWTLSGMAKAKPYVEWTTEEHPEFDDSRRAYFDKIAEATPDTTFENQTYSVAEMWRFVREDLPITGFRVGFGNPEPARVCVQAFMTAADSRHNVNNTAFVRACADYFHWTGDVEFLRIAMPRIRRALQYAIEEFRVEEHGCVFTPWFGHDGTSGLEFRDGQKIVRPGYGIGNNYWDLIPFGGYDTLATSYLVDALGTVAELERSVVSHPEWSIPDAGKLNPNMLSALRQTVQQRSRKRLWNPETGRFGSARDVHNHLYDYGFTFVNLEAIYYGLASNEQANEIMDWISGKRFVSGDTSPGVDVYHWRFGPRSTTLRNTEYYFSGWTGPESIPWGGQVQDGGAVLGFSYYDIMSRLKVYGPNNAWSRLEAVTDWFHDVWREGGYAAYYSKPERGTLQGLVYGPGGQGIDVEFLESVLFPQVMLYGFMGFTPKADGFSLRPALPDAWPELRINNIRWQGVVLDLSADKTEIEIFCNEGSKSVRVELVPGKWRKVELQAGESVTLPRP